MSQMHRVVVLSVLGMLATAPAHSAAIFVDSLPNGDSGQHSIYVDSGTPIALIGNAPAKAIPDLAGPYNYSGMGSFSGTTGGTGLAPQAYLPGAGGIWGGGAGGSSGSGGGAGGSSGGSGGGAGGGTGAGGTGGTNGTGAGTGGNGSTPPADTSPTGGGSSGGGSPSVGPQPIVPTQLFGSTPPSSGATDPTAQTPPTPLRIAEPASLAALGVALLGLGALRRRRSR
jgi:hypothetical protein